MGGGGEAKVAVCSCRDGVAVDEAALRAALGEAAEIVFHEELCRRELGAARVLLEEDAPLTICCAQEAPLFSELAADCGREAPLSFVNIRETAGWSAQGARATPKIAALIAAAFAPVEPAPLTELESAGRCLIAGPARQALELAGRLKEDLRLSVLLTEVDDDVLPPLREDFILRKGRLEAVTGRFGGFSARLSHLERFLPWAREGWGFSADGAANAEEEYDLIIEISDASARFGRHGREGCFHARPGDAAALAEIAGAAAALVGVFEKPLYARCERSLCVHERNGVTGCSRCIDVCPGSAISADGEAVRIDAAICEGCGDCAAVCPSGAMSSLMPRANDLIRRGNAMLRAFRAAGGEAPVMLFHEAAHGEPLIAALARHGEGLPAHVIPVALHSAGMLSHAEMAALMAAGAARIAVFAPRAKAAELAGLKGEMALLEAFLTGLGYGPETAPALLTGDDPFELGEWLAALARAPMPAHPVAPLGGKRDIARMALSALHDHAPAPVEALSLPAGAPWGRVVVDESACTLCLACVSSCPAGALSDNPERPQLRFSQGACVQCGICRRACPEKAVTLEPGYDFTPAAGELSVLVEDEPMTCPACGKAFGPRRAVEGVIARLAALGNPMFASEEQRELLRYCEDCRVIAISMRERDPFAAGAPPRPRVTEDYLDDAAGGGKEDGKE